MKSSSVYYSTGIVLLLALSSARTTTAFVRISTSKFSWVTSITTKQIHVNAPTNTARRPTSLVPLQAAGGGGGGKGKGFNNAPQPEPKKKAAVARTTETTTTTTTTTNTPTPSSGSSSSAASSTGSLNPGRKTQNPGQKALEDMRRVRAEEKDAELRNLRDLVQTDSQIREAPAVIPERVAQRMGKRMLPFVGIPFVGGLTAFTAFYYYAVYKNMEFQPALVAGSTIAILVFSLLGITYSVMSSSWDEDREGDFLGTEEFGRNLNNIREGLGRSRENALLRDKMESLTGEELKQAMENLERKEAAEAKKVSGQSLSSKLKDELE